MEDPAVFMGQAEPGAVIYAFSAAEDVLIEFLVREESSVLEAVPKGTGLQIRSGAALENGVLVVTVLMAFDPGQAIYPSFWNFWHPMENPAEGHIFDHMAAQPEFVVKWFGDSGQVEKMMAVPNPLRDFFESCAREARKLRPWTVDEFDHALDAFLENAGSLEDLWKAL